MPSVFTCQGDAKAAAWNRHITGVLHLHLPQRPQRRARLVRAAADPAAAPSAEDPSSAASAVLDLEKWSEEEREGYTHAILQAFLSADTSALPARPPARRPSRQAPPAAQGGAAPPEPRSPQSRGLQGQVVAHLLEGNFDEAWLGEVPPHTLNWSIVMLGKLGRLDLAQQLFHWMRLRATANEHSFVKLCEACAAARQPRAAMQAWRNVRRMPSGAPLGALAAGAVVRAFRDSGDLEASLAALEELSRRGARLNQYAFNAVLRLCADLGDADTALCVLQDMREGCWGGEPMRPDVRSYSAVCAALAAAGKWSRTAAVHRLLREDGIRPDVVLYTHLMACYAAAGRPEAVEALLDGMQDDGLRPNRTHWNSLLYAYAEAQRYDGCMDAYRRMCKDARLRPSAHTLVALLRAAFYARVGAAAASWVLGLMEQHEVELNVELGTALICCCRHFDESRDDGAQQALLLATRVLGDMRAVGGAAQPNVRTYNSFMLVQVAAGEWDAAVGTFEGLEGEEGEGVELNDAAWAIAAEAARLAGAWERAASLEATRQTLSLLHCDP